MLFEDSSCDESTIAIFLDLDFLESVLVDAIDLSSIWSHIGYAVESSDVLEYCLL